MALLVIATTAYIVLTARWAMRSHDGFGTLGYDFGIFDQGVWLRSRFERPFVTIMGRHLLGDHTSFILLPLAPVYWLIPSAKGLHPGHRPGDRRGAGLSDRPGEAPPRAPGRRHRRGIPGPSP